MTIWRCSQVRPCLMLCILLYTATKLPTLKKRVTYMGQRTGWHFFRQAAGGIREPGSM